MASEQGGPLFFENENFYIEMGQRIGLIGPSGGKTTLLEIIAGLRQPQSGEYFVDGKRVGWSEIRNW